MIAPYPVYLEISFQQVRRKDPRDYSVPHLHFAQLQKGVKWLKLFGKLWPERLSNELRHAATLPQFHMSSDLGLPAQRAFRKVVSSSKEPHTATRRAASYAIERKIVTVGDALGRLPEDYRRIAVERLRLEVTTGQIARQPEPRPPAPEKLIQTCYGWGWHSRTSHRCTGCGQMSGCLPASLERWLVQGRPRPPPRPRSSMPLRLMSIVSLLLANCFTTLTESACGPKRTLTSDCSPRRVE